MVAERFVNVNTNQPLPLSSADSSVFGPSGASHAIGLVPDPGSSAGATRFLREDGTFASPTLGAFSAHTNHVNFQFIPGSPNQYVLYPPAFTRFNLGGYYDTATGKFTPPSGATLVRLDASIWVVGGFLGIGGAGAGSGSLVCKWIKNWTVTAGNVLTSGTDAFAGIGNASDFYPTTAYIQAGGYDACSPGDYYSLFLFIDSTTLGVTTVTIDGHPSHTFITAAVVG